MNNQETYIALMHAVQTGVLLQMQLEDARGVQMLGETSPKHLHTGVNAAMIDSAALCRVLVAKGIMTMDEMHASLVQVAAEEVASYEKRLNLAPGTLR